MDSKQLLEVAAKACDDKRAEEILAIDVKTISGITDYFLICHANSDRQVQAIAREVKDQAHKNGLDVNRLEGFNEARWVLIDLGDVVVHVFHKEERGYYNLERLYRDAEFIEFEQVD
ncbi:ribosome silencing factor [Macrococcus equipercicus]|uniref:Ribosomal silencing factor RsfS n=1 Tax=Macrococcus equipercicus TaxID=69967 RepID=A0A9Q9F0N9_9STAP|nr:ribosome silencing factor [Macrococcus equipercicus]KAA1040051.1 ribosome silencing factor [Macrococcus equipercicus]UTH13000.1 ribosome silencing factor [Macrococcus equipercicus]